MNKITVSVELEPRQVGPFLAFLESLELERTKFCAACQSDVPRSGFNLNRNGVFGLQTYCRKCHAAMMRDRRR